MAKNILSHEGIKLNVGVITKEQAITMAGQLLVQLGYVEQSYADSMFEREEVSNTYLGNHIAVPHGIGHRISDIKRTGIVILQSREGIIYGEDGEIAHLIIGIAAIGNEHMDILTKIALSLEDIENVYRGTNAKTVSEIFELLDIETPTEV